MTLYRLQGRRDDIGHTIFFAYRILSFIAGIFMKPSGNRRTIKRPHMFNQRRNQGAQIYWTIEGLKAKLHDTLSKAP